MTGGHRDRQGFRCGRADIVGLAGHDAERIRPGVHYLIPRAAATSWLSLVPACPTISVDKMATSVTYPAPRRRFSDSSFWLYPAESLEMHHQEDLKPAATSVPLLPTVTVGDLPDWLGFNDGAIFSVHWGLIPRNDVGAVLFVWTTTVASGMTSVC